MIDMTEGLELSPLESHRFGLRVSRWRGQSLDARRLALAIYAQRADLVIARLPSEHAAEANRMSMFGLHPQYADTLVYHDVTLDEREELPYRNRDLAFRSARHADAGAIESLVRACFNGYRSHYANNPRLDRAAVLEGYVEWAMQHACQGNSHLHTWLATRDHQVLGFAACRENADADEAEIVLNGVHPDHAGLGIYGDLLRFVRSEYSKRGRKRLLISTQITNHAVQRAWARQGFRLHSSWATFHLTPWLSAGELVIDSAVTFGDALPLHVLREMVLELLPNALFLRVEQVFLCQPPPEQCRIQMRFANGIPKHGPAKAVALVEDVHGSPCLVVFLDLTRQ